jgi:RNA-binding protein YhbY
MVHSSLATLQILCPAALLCIFASFHQTANAFSVRPPPVPARRQPLLALRSVLNRDVLLRSTPSPEDSWDIEEEDEVVTDENDDDDDDDDEAIDENDFEILFKEEVDKQDAVPVKGVEKAWRYAKRPLISVGAKGATFSHGNSLRQLLEAHTVVKVKVNTQKFGSLEAAFEQLRELAVESGASADIEMVQAREFEKVIMFGIPGTLARIAQGEFPPPPPPPYVPPVKEDKEE